MFSLSFALCSFKVTFSKLLLQPAGRRHIRTSCLSKQAARLRARPAGAEPPLHTRVQQLWSPRTQTMCFSTSNDGRRAERSDVYLLIPVRQNFPNAISSHRKTRCFKMTRVERSGNGTWGSTGRHRCQPLTIRHVIVSVGSHGADMINHRGFNRFELTGLRFKTSSREAQPNIPASIQQPSESERNEFMSPSSRLIRINSSFPRKICKKLQNFNLPSIFVPFLDTFLLNPPLKTDQCGYLSGFTSWRQRVVRIHKCILGCLCKWLHESIFQCAQKYFFLCLNKKQNPAPLRTEPSEKNARAAKYIY